MLTYCFILLSWQQNPSNCNVVVIHAAKDTEDVHCLHLQRLIPQKALFQNIRISIIVIPISAPLQRNCLRTD